MMPIKVQMRVTNQKNHSLKNRISKLQMVTSKTNGEVFLKELLVQMMRLNTLKAVKDINADRKKQIDAEATFFSGSISF